MRWQPQWSFQEIFWPLFIIEMVKVKLLSFILLIHVTRLSNLSGFQDLNFNISWNDLLKISICMTIDWFLIMIISKIFYRPHPNSIKLLNTFPNAVVMDSNYKVNKYRPMLLEFIGVTSIELTYSTAFSYMMYEKEENFIWSLKRCHDLLKSPYISPNVFISPRQCFDECC